MKPQGQFGGDIRLQELTVSGVIFGLAISVSPGGLPIPARVYGGGIVAWAQRRLCR